MKRTILASAIFSFLLLAGWCSVARAQQVQGSFTGQVTDSSGAVIGGAQVTAVEQDTGFTRGATTVADGSYLIPLLPPGHYRLEVQAAGFEKTRTGTVQLLVNAHLKIDFQMKVGAQATEITVSAPPTVLDTQSSSVGTTIEQGKVQELPLNGRHFLELTLFTPGVVPAAGGSENSERGGAINVNGLRESMNNYLLDGMSNTTMSVGQYVVTPPLDSVQEFRMETGMYDARFGGQAGAQVNMVTRSGTNQLHGSLHDFVRNKIFDAPNYFEPEVPPFVRNQFGATLGGPITLPSIYKGRDRSFFFLAFEELRESRAFYNNSLVPTLKERGGDFSDLLDSDCAAPTVLINPVALLSGTVQPFTNINQVLPAADPVGQALMNLYPQPNIPNAACGDANYQAEGKRGIALATYTARVDHQWGTKDTMFFRFGQTLDHTFLPFAGGSALPGYGQRNRDGFMIAGLDWTHTFRHSLLNEFKFGYNRWKLDYINQDQGQTIAQQLGILGLSTIPSQTGVPNMNVGSYVSMGSDESTPQTGAVNTFELADTVTQVHGNHSMAYGVSVASVHRGNFSEDNTIRGEFDFTGLVTGGLGNLTPGDLGLPANTILGNGLADALLGLPTYWINGIAAYISGAMNSPNFFFQDNWKVRPNLTLNLGLRYEYNGLVTDQKNQFANFDFQNGDIMVAGTSAVTLMQYDSTTGSYTTVGTTSLGSTAENRALQYPDRDDFAPRLGFSWSPQAKTVVRGGGGVFYDRTFGDVDFQKSANPPFAKESFGELTTVLPLNPAEVGTGAILQSVFEPNMVGPAFASPSPFNLHFRDAKIYEWTLNVQRELPRAFLLEVGYVGTRGLHLVREWDPNEPIPNPATQTTTQPYPNYGNFTYTDSNGDSIYHSLQTKLERHFSDGMALLVAYTYSKSIDTNSTVFGTNRNTNFPQNSHDLAAERARSEFDIRHRLSAAYVYKLPFGAGRFQAGNHVLNYLVSDWEVSGIFTAQSGPPFTPQISGDISQTNEGDDRPNLVGNPVPAKQTPNQWVLASAFSAPAPYTFGDAGRNSLTGPGLASWDFSVSRHFRLTEGTALEFDGQIFNLLNRANFDVPQADLASPSFGKIFNTVQAVAGFASGGPGDPREVQLGLKLIF
ncbi:putative TonB-dependent receptor [Candidatus Sulfotelmatobacter kueseliae]|uniref:Putative TonB-dependent receptor n=1 Tax=Candidatus Sulfotelmatobacter kueseliae TaxID=2042962 RepID=A0A2U3JXY0_9BACT|nr:putative TonB-dependent receptor [Candidatus Sulfotelmatobacter kueseliae]